MTVLVEENEHLQHLIADLREQILLKAQQIEDLSKVNECKADFEAASECLIEVSILYL